MDPAARIRELEAEVENLRAENEWLRGMPVSFGLRVMMQPTWSGPSTSRLCEILLRRGQVSNEQLITAMWGGSEPGGADNVIKLYVCKARKVLKPLGVDIQLLRGVGYRIPDEDRARLRALIAAHETQVAA